MSDLGPYGEPAPPSREDPTREADDLTGTPCDQLDHPRRPSANAGTSGTVQLPAPAEPLLGQHRLDLGREQVAAVLTGGRASQPLVLGLVTYVAG
jgi:hypothetical protein